MCVANVPAGAHWDLEARALLLNDYYYMLVGERTGT